MKSDFGEPLPAITAENTIRYTCRMCHGEHRWVSPLGHYDRVVSDIDAAKQPVGAVLVVVAYVVVNSGEKP